MPVLKSKDILHAKSRARVLRPQCQSSSSSMTEIEEQMVSERFNKTPTRMVKACLGREQTEWDKTLGYLATVYTATPPESTCQTQNMMMFGRQARVLN